MLRGNNSNSQQQLPLPIISLFISFILAALLPLVQSFWYHWPTTIAIVPSRNTCNLDKTSHPAQQRRRTIMSSSTNDPLSSETPSSSTTTTTTQVIGIRHATSIANEWMHRPGNCWGDPTFCDDPQLQDAGLSATGWQQVQTLRDDLLPTYLTTGLQRNEILVVVSPLMRCLQTWYYGVRPVLLDYFASSASASSNSTNANHYHHPNNNSNNSITATKTTKLVPRTVILPLATERVYTASDHGKVYSELLQTEFAKTATEVDWTFLKQQEHQQEQGYDNDLPWWYTNPNAQRNKSTKEYANEWRPAGQGQYYAVPGEPEHVFEARMVGLEKWMAQHGKGYKLVILVSHWGVLRHFTNDHVNNCGVCSWTLMPSAPGKNKETELTLSERN